MLSLFDNVKSFIQKKLQSQLIKAVKSTAETEITIKPDPEYRWQQTKSALLLGNDLLTNADGSTNPTKLTAMNVLFDNFKAFTDKTSVVGVNSAQNVATLNKVILPVMRKFVPSMLAWELVGVTALSSATGQVSVLRRRATGDDITTETVESKNRKLSARWSFESISDERITELAKRNINIEAELLAALAQEVIAECDQELLRFLRSLAQKNSVTVDIGNDYSAQQQTNNLVDAIINQAANIANFIPGKTGNWVVVSPTVFVMLHCHEKFKKTAENTLYGGFVGILDDNIRVYVDPFASMDVPVLIGYQGTDPADNGVQWCPYTVLKSAGVLIDPATFEPVVSFLTNYGVYDMQSTSDSPIEAADYYALVNINTKHI